MIILWIAIFLASLVGLIKSADYFTKYSEKIGILLGMSSFIVGVTIVAIGTSLPELVSSLFALSAGETTFVADNIIGSNIANALLILGISGVVAKRGLHLHTSLIDVDLPFFFMSMVGFGYFALDKQISFVEGLTLLAFFVVFIIYNIRSKPAQKDEDELEQLVDHYKNRNKTKDILKYIGIIIASVGVLAVSAKYLIDSILTLSELFHVSSSVLTITVVALGTSLPEILTSIVAVKRGNHAMAVGNVLGSNTFNLLLIAGIPAMIKPLALDPVTFSVGLPFLVIATFIAIFVMFDNRVRPWEGVAMLFFYLIFIGKIIGIL